jgi:hypothetical protein
MPLATLISKGSEQLRFQHRGKRGPAIWGQCSTTLIRDLQGLGEWWQAAAPDIVPRAPGYVIHTSSYVPNSAGIVCLYRLCDALNRLGYATYMTGGRVTAPDLIAPLIHPRVAKALCASGYAAIYPETIRGNPLEARTVVRWVLNRPGLLGGDEIYDEAEHVYCYTGVYRPYIRNRIQGKLYLPTIDEKLFYCDDANLSKRSLECCYIGKSRWQDGIVERRGLVEITRDYPRKSELGKLFRAARVLYCFDNSSIITYEALLCGCPVVIIPDGTQSKADYERSELGLDGIAWGKDEFSSAPVDVVALRKKLHDIKRQFSAQLSDIVQATAPRGLGAALVVSSAPMPPNAPTKSVFRSLRAMKRLIWQTLDHGRAAEQSLRRWRKRWQTALRNRQTKPRLDSEASESFDLADSHGKGRCLECFYVGRSKWQNGIVDQMQAFEITSDMPARQLAILLRSTKTFYTFEKRSRLIQLALNCGSDVVVVGKKGQCKRIFSAKGVESVAAPPCPLSRDKRVGPGSASN